MLLPFVITGILWSSSTLAGKIAIGHGFPVAPIVSFREAIELFPPKLRVVDKKTARVVFASPPDPETAYNLPPDRYVIVYDKAVEDYTFHTFTISLAMGTTENQVSCESMRLYMAKDSVISICGESITRDDDVLFEKSQLGQDTSHVLLYIPNDCHVSVLSVKRSITASVTMRNQIEEVRLRGGRADLDTFAHAYEFDQKYATIWDIDEKYAEFTNTILGSKIASDGPGFLIARYYADHVFGETHPMAKFETHFEFPALTFQEMKRGNYILFQYTGPGLALQPNQYIKIHTVRDIPTEEIDGDAVEIRLSKNPDFVSEFEFAPTSPKFYQRNSASGVVEEVDDLRNIKVTVVENENNALSVVFGRRILNHHHRAGTEIYLHIPCSLELTITSVRRSLNDVSDQVCNRVKKMTQASKSLFRKRSTAPLQELTIGYDEYPDWVMKAEDEESSFWDRLRGNHHNN